MSTQNICVQPGVVVKDDAIDAADIRLAFPDNTMKRLAQALSVPVDTARDMLYRRIPASRRREIALALVAQIDEQTTALALLKVKIARTLEEIDSATVVQGNQVAQQRATNDSKGKKTYRQSGNEKQARENPRGTRAAA